MTDGLSNWCARNGFYAIIDPEHCGGRDPIATAEAVLSGGCAVLQLRAKQMNDHALLDLARALKARCARADVPFVMNDRADIAVLAGADGLHLGQDDMPVADARVVVADMRIGVSTHSLRQAADAQQDGADLIGFGPVFATVTKDDPDPVVGLEQLARVCADTPIPVVAIGGITSENAAQARKAGASLVAAIRAVTQEEAVEQAARTMHAAST